MKSFPSTRSIRILAALAVASGTAGLASLTAMSSTSSAQADPLASTAEVGVGADVTQDLFDGLSGAAAPGTSYTHFLNPLTTGGTSNTTIISFDAFPPTGGGSTLSPGAITTKVGGPAFDRPNSTTNGVAALEDEKLGNDWENPTASQSFTHTEVNLTGQINFARAARGPKGTSTDLTWSPFARDAVAYLFYDHGDGALNSLTTAQLKSLYDGNASTIGSDTVDPCLTISGSSPRSNFETAIGVTDSTASQFADPACSQIQQNSGNAFWTFASTLPTGTDAIIPISAGDWIGQNNGFDVDESNTARANGLTLGSVTDGSSVLGQPFTGTGTSLVPNTTYYQDTNYGYNLYTVIPTDVLSGQFVDQNLVSLFTNTATSPANNAAICQTPIQTEINDHFGFDSLTAAEGSCGSTTQTGNS
jgi:hypothetical protein